jgi:hypothetical protein
MANKFEFTISAVDKATKTIKGINKATAGITSPISNISKSIASMGQEVRRNPLIKFTENVGKSALGAAESFSKLISPLGAITGATTIAGFGALIESVGKSGIAIENASRRTGIAVEGLQKYRAMAVAAGLSADDMQQALVRLGTAAQDSEFGRNNDFRNLLNQIGVVIHRTKSGLVDTAQLFEDIRDATSRKSDPNIQALIADHSELGALLPILQMTADEYRNLANAVDRARVASKKAAENNAEMGKSWNQLKLDAEGYSNFLSKEYAPAITKALRGTSAFLESSSNKTPMTAKSPIAVSPQLGLLGAVSGGISGIGEYTAKLLSGGKFKTQDELFKEDQARRNSGGKIGGLAALGGIPALTSPSKAELATGLPKYGTAEQSARNMDRITILQQELAMATDPRDRATISAEIAKTQAANASGNPFNVMTGRLTSEIAGTSRQDNSPQKVVVEVQVKGDTRGVTATARTDSPSVTTSPPRISLPLPTGPTS